MRWDKDFTFVTFLVAIGVAGICTAAYSCGFSFASNKCIHHRDNEATVFQLADKEACCYRSYVRYGHVDLRCGPVLVERATNFIDTGKRCTQ
jgi:hypothetical protein